MTGNFTGPVTVVGLTSSVAVQFRLSVVVTVAGSPWIVAVTLLTGSEDWNDTLIVLPGTIRFLSAWSDVNDTLFSLLTVS